MPQSASPSSRHSQFSIARDLNLSQASVSNALNGKRHLCNPETYTRIWAYATQVGYRGRGIAPEVAPSSGGLKQVGVIFGGDPLLTRCDPAMVSLLLAIERALARHGVSVVSLGSPGELWLPLEEPVRAGLAKHALLILGEVEADFVARLVKRPRRVVTLGSAFPRLAPAILNHDEQAADLLVSHLKNHGHRRILWLGGGVGKQSLASKHLALGHAAAKHGMELVAEPATFGKNSHEAGRRGAREFLQRSATRGGVPTAVVCSDARVAHGAMEQFALAGLVVPRDLSVAALEAGGLPTDKLPAVTAAGSDPEAMGMLAAEMLNSGSPLTATYTAPLHPPARLLLGETVGPRPAEADAPLHILRSATDRKPRGKAAHPPLENPHAA